MDARAKTTNAKRKKKSGGSRQTESEASPTSVASDNDTTTSLRQDLLGPLLGRAKKPTHSFFPWAVLATLPLPSNPQPPINLLSCSPTTRKHYIEA
ncbi:hypothetical protein HPB51_003101 [Rhipicephalus microplus]|uniref:Uncharacterized protein n=1 Tax=Rhipicephalus microplus TaxID=6941 RepID=A0A9J6EXS9_RHIMP|nr:hypothetical protein HPB51_003101 [Rhipicephalus microplus]